MEKNLKKLWTSIHWKSDAKVIDAQTKNDWSTPLREISLAGIARVTGVSKKWLQDYVNAKYASVERQVKVSAKEKSDWTLNVMNCGHL